MGQLVRYDAMCRAIAECHQVDDAKELRNKAVALEHYSRQAQNLEMERMAAEIRIRAERRTGQLLRQTDLSQGGVPPGYTPQPALADFGLSRKQSSLWQKLADIEEPEFETRLRALVKPPTTAAMLRSTHVSRNSGEIEWYTPADIIDRARRVMGGIDLDPASSREANETIQATRFYTEADDGLEHDWHGRVWLNPPYKTALVKAFTEKLLSESGVTAAVVLTNNATETSWGQALLQAAKSVCFPAGRVRFVQPDGTLAGTPLQGQMICAFGEAAGFLREFGDLGRVVSLQ